MHPADVLKTILPTLPRITAKGYWSRAVGRTHPWTVFAVDGVLYDILDITDDAVQSALGTTLAELTGDWAYTQSLGKVPPTQLLGQAAYDSNSIVGLQYPSVKNLGKGTGFVVFADRLPANPPSFLDVYDPYLNVSQRLP